MCAAEPGGPGVDLFGWYVATLHETIGHDATAAVIGQPAGDRAACLLCVYEAERSDAARAEVVRALSGGPPVTAGFTNPEPYRSPVPFGVDPVDPRTWRHVEPGG